MNAPTAGWNPDPTGRHEYRYWDGSGWTDDVSDSGATSVDPVNPVDGPVGFGDDPTAAIDATQQYAPQPGPQPGPPPGAFGGPVGPQSGGYASPYGTSGQLPAAGPVKAGPTTGLLVGLAAVAVALIAGIAYLVTSGDGDGDDDIATETTQTTEDTTDTTEPDDDTTDTTEPDDDTTDTTDRDTSDDAFVDILASSMELEADGAITSEQAQCAAQAMVDELGLDTIIEMGSTGDDPFADGSLTTDQQAAILTAMTDCIPMDVLLDMGVDAEGAEG
jgi:hypothetical protein